MNVDHHHASGGSTYIPGCEGCKALKRAYYQVNKRRFLDRDRDGANSRMRKRHELGKKAAAFARQLEAGVQVASASNHHAGMRLLKAPRPEGLTLSLINPSSPSAYWGYNNVKGERRRYRLSTDPNDYIWESHADNMKRGYPALSLEKEPR